ncbi:MAG: VOC family protein [Caldilineales bacterium]|nr:VOC family protein [Caldilineales bacterium]
MNLKFDYVRLLVDDFPACFRFYRDVLGLSPRMGGEDDVYAEFETGGVSLALFRRDFMMAAIDAKLVERSADTAVLTFSVLNVDAAAQELRKRGATLVARPVDRPDWIIRTAHFRDPDGNLIEINAPLNNAQTP